MGEIEMRLNRGIVSEEMRERQARYRVITAMKMSVSVVELLSSLKD
jgi:hypothetical protein